MRFCCNDTGINLTQDLPELTATLKQLRGIGFEVIGVHGVAGASDDAVRRFRDLTQQHGVSVAMSPTGFQPAHPDESKRPQEHEQLRETLRKMQLLGGDLIHIAGGGYDGTGWWHHPKNFTAAALDDFITEMKKVAPHAEEFGICVCPETTQWCTLNSPERMVEFVDGVDSEYVKVTFDPVNHLRPDRIYASGEFVRSSIAMLGDRIGQLHVKDVDIKSGLVVHIEEAPVGTGLLDHEAVIRASDDLEPSKTFSLEHFNDDKVDTMVQRENAFKHLQGIATRIGHTWSSPQLTRREWIRNQ